MHQLLGLLCILNLIYVHANQGSLNFNCLTMEINGKDSQETESPYAISVDSGYFYKERQCISVTIKKVSPDVPDFIGFYIQVRPDPSPATIGIFSQSDGVSPIKCSNPDDAAQQSSLNPKTSLHATWTAGAVPQGNIYVKATVAQDKDTYWSMLSSEAIEYGAGNCPSLTVPKNTIKMEKSCNYNNTISYKCKDGYVATDEDDLTRICLNTGEWSGMPPDCTEISSSMRFSMSWMTVLIGTMALEGAVILIPMV